MADDFAQQIKDRPWGPWRVTIRRAVRAPDEITVAMGIAGAFARKYDEIYLAAYKEQTMAKKGVPKHNGSGKGRRANQGRSGCKTTRATGNGRK